MSDDTISDTAVQPRTIGRRAGVRRNDASDVLQKAAECFAVSGYQGTSMRAIADAAGILPGSLYSHFDSKLHILQTILSNYFGLLIPQQRATLESGGTVQERLTEMVRGCVDIAGDHPAVVMVIELDWHNLIAIPELQPNIAQAAENNELFREMIEEGVSNGEIRSDVDVDFVVHMIQHVTLGLLDHRYRTPIDDSGPARDFTARQISDGIVALITHGLFTTPTGARKA